jgi:hypothetical protein
MELVQQILANIQTPWAIGIGSILAALFPVKVVTPPGVPDKTTPFIWSILKRFLPFASSDSSGGIGGREFETCHDAVKYLAEQADKAQAIELRDQTLDLLRPYAALQFPKSSTSKPAHDE